MKRIGIIGGVSPEATSILYLDMVERIRTLSGGNYPDMMIYNLPFNNEMENVMITGKIGDPRVHQLIELLFQSYHLLVENKSAMVILPCNTLTYYFKLPSAPNAPVLLNPIDTTVNYVRQKGYRRVALMASEGTCKLNVFSSLLEEHNITTILPGYTDQQLINCYILAQLTKKVTNPYTTRITELMDKLSIGVDAIVLGCTDLFPLSNVSLSRPVEIIDSLSKLMDASCDLYLTMS